MAAEQTQRPYAKTAIFGAVSIAMYFLLLTKQDMINETVVKGGLFALVPIAMAFLFSYIHGNFTGCFWSSCGIEASKKHKEVK
jgi:hypothetical protein